MTSVTWTNGREHKVLGCEWGAENSGFWLARHLRDHAALRARLRVVAELGGDLSSIITRQAIRRGSSASVKDLIAAIENFIDCRNGRCHPFTLTKTADELLPRCKQGKRITFT